MRLFKIVAIIVLLSNLAFAETANIYIAFNSNIHEVEDLFREKVKPDGQMVFTYVPRGLIVSIDEKVFFNDNNEKIRSDGTCVLDEIGEVLKQIDTLCVIEGHTRSIEPEKSRFNTNWELSLARANNLARYLMRCLKIKPNKIVSMGFGEFVPFANDELSTLDNRIDFVILHYDERR